MELTATGYAIGVGRLLAVVLPAWVGVRAWRRRFVTGWSGARCALADVVGALAVVVVVGEALGSVGLFRRGALVVVLILFGAGSVIWCRRSTPVHAAAGGRRETRLTGAARVPVRDVIIASASCALVLSQWSTWVARTVSFGIGNAGGGGNGDSLWYHMPIAASFAQSGWTTRLLYMGGDTLVTYYPANVSLLHAVGIFAMGSDVLSIFVNIALVLVALLAGWCIGERHGVGASTLAGVAVALTLPTVVYVEAGTAKDDMLGVAGLLACVAFATSAHPIGTERVAAIFSGLAAGLAIGSKVTFIAPVLAVAVGLAVLTPAGTRRSTLLNWSAAAFATGGYWYVRNLIRVGSPLPQVSIGIGPVRLPRPPTPSIDAYTTSVVHVLADSRVWHLGLFPGLRMGFGSAWPIILALVATSLTVGLITMRGRDLLVPVVGAVGLAAFLVTPGPVWGASLITTPGVRLATANFFSYDLRYLLPTVALGLVIVPVVARRWRYGAFIATAMLGVALLATQLTAQGRASWAKNHGPVAVDVAVITVVLVAAIISHVFSFTARSPLVARLAMVAATVAVIAFAWPVASLYQRDRLTGLDLAHWANMLPGDRIGYSGFVFSYPLYGAHLQNHVEMIGEHGPDGDWHATRTCAAWRTDIRRAGVQYLVVPAGGTQVGLGIDLARWHMGLPGGEPPDEPPESRWSRTDPGLRVVFNSAEGATVYEVTGPASAAGCSASSKGPGVASDR